MEASTEVVEDEASPSAELKPSQGVEGMIQQSIIGESDWSEWIKELDSKPVNASTQLEKVEEIVSVKVDRTREAAGRRECDKKPQQPKITLWIKTGKPETKKPQQQPVKESAKDKKQTVQRKMSQWVSVIEKTKEKEKSLPPNTQPVSRKQVSDQEATERWDTVDEWMEDD